MLRLLERGVFSVSPEIASHATADRGPLLCLRRVSTIDNDVRLHLELWQ